ncbi:MAG: YHS domain-containing protein, partial [Acetobacteraceae bacterium]
MGEEVSSNAIQKDPVCGMSVSADSKYRVAYGGREYLFCSNRCREKFAANPEQYTKALPVSAAAPPPSGTIYTCPMHPEIRRNEPGSCPICGMALEPLQPTADAGPHPELRDMTRRFWVGAVLTLPIVILEMGGHVRALNLHHYVSPVVSMWIELALATPVVLWAGWPLLERGWASVRHRSLNMFSLISLGVSVAYLYSLAAMFVPGAFPTAVKSAGGLIPVYFESAAVITVLVLLGQMLELRAREATGGAIRALLNLAPKMARRIRSDGTDEEVSLASVQVGDR